MLSSMVLIPVAALLLAAQLPQKTQLDVWLVTPIEEATTPDNQEITLKLARDQGWRFAQAVPPRSFTGFAT